MKKEVPVIREAEKFYGYITGIGVERDYDNNTPARLYATFEYAGTTEVWEVPSLELFALLAKHLCDMAQERKDNQSFGYSKLWIFREDGVWHASEP